MSTSTRVVSLVLVVAWLARASPGEAVDWPRLLGTEDGRPARAFTPFGSAQIVVESTPFATPVEGLEDARAHDGEMATFNLEEPVELRVQRARLGARGSIPGTRGRISYLVDVEAGQNETTRTRGPVLLDASITLSVIPGVRLRIGQFKLPLADEVLEPNPTTADFIFYSPVVTELLLEQPVAGGHAGRAWTFRDVGIQAFDAWTLGHVEVAYAAMVSQGHMGALDLDESFDVTLRVQSAWLFHTDEEERLSPFREELSVYAWRQQGPRVVDDAPTMRLREGVGAHLRAFHVRSRVEVVHADGALYVGAREELPGEPVAIDPDGDAWGFTADVAIEHLGPFELDFGVDELHRLPRDPARARVMRHAIVGGQWHVTPNTRLLANCELRRLFVGPDASSDTRKIAATMAHVVAAQLAVTF